ncbi:hypothetical protein [Blastococcus sp. TF02A-26]|uniref:hypothetical protein n=1 Tax=Blastococcus sp. TF02A-26 TaxID=2250577 RepID=UPI0011BF7A78|nr:hypothetical protein [Blastococcus sp. TF02A-26]
MPLGADLAVVPGGHATDLVRAARSCGPRMKTISLAPQAPGLGEVKPCVDAVDGYARIDATATDRVGTTAT